MSGLLIFAILFAVFGSTSIVLSITGKHIKLMKNEKWEMFHVIIPFALFFIALVCAWGAENNANKELESLKNQRDRMAQNTAFTQKIEINEIKEFNRKVAEAYDSIPYADRKFFVKDKEIIFEELMIPLDKNIA